MISLKCNKKIEETFSLWIFIIIFVLYLFGLLGLLKIGVYIVVTIAIVCMLFFLYTIYSNRLMVKKFFLTPSFVIFILFFVLAWWAQRGRMFTSWDEFSHWGTVVKNMYIFDALGNHPEATTTFRGYPPSTALFEYFWVKLSGNFSEGNLYRSMNILYFSLMLPFFSNIRWKNFSTIVVRFVLVLILPLAFFQDFYTNLMVDAILGVIFASILINYYTNESSTFKIFNISLALSILTLTKSAGFGLAIIAIIIIAIDLLFVKRQNLKLVSCPILFTIIAKYSWSIYLKITKTNVAWDITKIGVHSIENLFTENAPHYQIVTIKNFFNALTGLSLTNYSIKISFVGWLVILLSMSMVLITYAGNEEEKLRFKVVTISLFIGATLYTFSLLILYIFTYTEYEATNLASYSRYISTYLLGILIFVVGTICLKAGSHHNKSNLSYSSVLLLFLLLITNVRPIINMIMLAPSDIQGTISKRAIYAPITKIKQIINPKTDKVYIISVASSGFDYWVSRYNITPIMTNIKNESWSIGKPYYKGDIWTENVSPVEWSQVLKVNYTYVYIYKTNYIFNKTYGKIFQGGSNHIKNNTLYHVNKNNGIIILEKMNICAGDGLIKACKR